MSPRSTDRGELDQRQGSAAIGIHSTGPTSAWMEVQRKLSVQDNSPASLEMQNPERAIWKNPDAPVAKTSFGGPER